MFASTGMDMGKTVQIQAIFLISQCIELDHKLKDEGEGKRQLRMTTKF